MSVKPTMTIPYIPGLLMNGEWIPPLRNYGGSGHSLADIIHQAGNDMFPSHHLARFDLLLAQDYEDPVPVDLVLVSKNSGAWYLLFVVPSRNADLESLIARLKTVREYVFGVREAEELLSQIDELDPKQTRRLVRDSPNLVVVTDDPRNDWREQLADSGVEASVMIVEPFRCYDQFVFRVNGETPTERGVDVIAICESHAYISNSLVVTWNNPSSIPPLGTITLRYGDVDTEWELLQGNLTWQLHPLGQFPLQDSPRFEIVEVADGLYSIRSSST